MSPVRFEHTISAGEQPQTYALDRAATGTGLQYDYVELSFITKTDATHLQSASLKGL
jgi:hypothetical protein